MAILERHPKYPGQFQIGDAVTPKVINDVLETAIESHDKAKAVYENMKTAKENAETALVKATGIETRANSGEFNGAVVAAQGLFGFQVQDGNLVLVYSGEAAPDLRIDGSGELILTI